LRKGWLVIGQLEEAEDPLLFETADRTFWILLLVIEGHMSFEFCAMIEKGLTCSTHINFAPYGRRSCCLLP